VIAEGVETQDDLDALSELGVPCAQGFHLGRPMPPDAVRDLLVA
jgi:EAL domain-containing protein (putative c-di-GMP-specific phosphodiesterase class I)